MSDSGSTAEDHGAAARGKRPSPWQPGALFHATRRYPRRSRAGRVDRLAGILRHGLRAPADCPDGSVCSDLSIRVTGMAVSYDSLVFLHRFGAESAIYTIGEPGRFFVFVNPALPVLTPGDLGANWPILCQDEVYVRDRVPPEHLTCVVVHPDDAESVVAEFRADFRRLGIPLLDHDGNIVWEPA